MTNQVFFFPEARFDRDVILLVDAVEHVIDARANSSRCDAVGGIEGLLPFAAAIGFTDRLFKRIGHAVGIENDAADDVTGRAPDGLNQGAF